LVNWESDCSVVPEVRGRLQPLCARWSRQDLDGAIHLVNNGVRSLRHLSNQNNVVRLCESDWKQVAHEDQFVDIDYQEDLRELGIT
jgi:molybdopterin-guanine dinucleotide biosynthesis protein A